MLQIKILGATPKGGKSICLSCKRGTVVRGQNCQEVIFCQGPFAGYAGKGIVLFKVAECADYHPVNVPWLHEMEDMARKIEARKRGPTGFNDPDARNDSEMEIIVTPPKEGSHDPF